MYRERARERFQGELEIDAAAEAIAQAEREGKWVLSAQPAALILSASQQSPLPTRPHFEPCLKGHNSQYS